jgi:hypothetical protein
MVHENSELRKNKLDYEALENSEEFAAMDETQDSLGQSISNLVRTKLKKKFRRLKPQMNSEILRQIHLRYKFLNLMHKFPQNEFSKTKYRWLRNKVTIMCIATKWRHHNDNLAQNIDKPAKSRR